MVAFGKAAFFAVLLSGHLLSTHAGRAQGVNTDKEAVDSVLFSVELVGAVAASAYVWSHGCQVGDPGRWTRLVDAIDERYRRCVAADSALARAVERQYAVELPVTNKKSIGSLAFERWIPRRAVQFEAERSEAACADPRLKNLIETGENVHHWMDGKLVLKLGDDVRWVDAPCGSFFPENLDK